jgi:hypothetical protein
VLERREEEVGTVEDGWIFAGPFGWVPIHSWKERIERVAGDELASSSMMEGKKSLSPRRTAWTLSS